MNAFISYSISDEEQYILTLLSQKVEEAGLTLVASYNQSERPDPQTANEIKNSVVFIGLMTGSGSLGMRSRVYSEFQQANLFRRPAILLIEDTVPVGLWEDHYHNTIRFNRYYINQAIDEVKTRINISQSPQPSENAAAWILGGIAVIALLSLLSSENK
jgi:hypothetical protein